MILHKMRLKKALKHATIWYAIEKLTKGGMLAVCVLHNVNKQFNLSLNDLCKREKLAAPLRGMAQRGT